PLRLLMSLVDVQVLLGYDWDSRLPTSAKRLQDSRPRPIVPPWEPPRSDSRPSHHELNRAVVNPMTLSAEDHAWR
ncbi:MAG: hypothetical protein J3Q66DRAFT_340320, partial [Benniella sp.]